MNRSQGQVPEVWQKDAGRRSDCARPLLQVSETDDPGAIAEHAAYITGAGVFLSGIIDVG